MDTEKLQELILFIANHPNVTDLGLTKLYKLIYFADVECLRALGQTATGSEYIKYEHGPVPSRGEKQLKMLRKAGALVTVKEPYGAYFIERVIAKEGGAPNVFLPQELQVLEHVCQRCGNQTASYLSELSHLEPAWHYAQLHDKLAAELMAYGYEEEAACL